MKNLSTRLMVALTLLMVQVSMAFAATTITVSSLDIQAGQQKDVTVSIAADQADIYQIQATVSLPQGLRLVATGNSYAQTAALTQGFVADIKAEDGTLLLSQLNMLTISAAKGAIATFRVEASESLAETAAINLTGIRVWHKGATTENVASATGIVKKTAAPAGTVKFFFGDSEVNLGAGTSTTVSVFMNNDFAVSGFEAILNLPAGVTATVTKAARISSDPQYTADKIVYFAGTAISGKQGELFNITLTADDSFNDNAIVTLSDIILTTPASKEIYVDDISLTLVAKDLAAYDAAISLIDDLQRKLDNAVATIESVYPDAQDELADDEDAIQDAIDGLHGKIDSDFDQNRLSLDEVKGIAAGISDDIDELLAIAKALQEVADLQALLDAAVEEIPGDLPESAYEELDSDVDAIQDQIDALKSQALSDGKLDAKKKQQVIDDIAALLKKIRTWLRGDVEFDQDVDMDDFYALTDSILSDNLPTAEQLNSFYRFDANADEDINVGDMQGIINICLGLSADGSVAAREAENLNAELNVESEATANGMRYTLTLKGMSYSGFQMDVEGARVLNENASLNVRKNQMDGRTRMLAIGMEQQEGQVIVVETSGIARFQNIVFTTAGAQTVKFSLNTTGINGLVADAAQQKSYDLNGRAVKVAKGVVIRGGKKLAVK